MSLEKIYNDVYKFSETPKPFKYEGCGLDDDDDEFIFHVGSSVQLEEFDDIDGLFRYDSIYKVLNVDYSDETLLLRDDEGDNIWVSMHCCELID